jgi:hypothetical protein
MSGRDLGEIKIIAGWSRYKSEISTGVSKNNREIWGDGRKIAIRGTKREDFKNTRPYRGANIC